MNKKIWKVSCKAGKSGIRQILMDLRYDQDTIETYLTDEVIMEYMAHSEYILFGVNPDSYHTGLRYGWDRYINLDDLIEDGYVYCGRLYSRQEKLKSLEYESNL